MGFWQGFKQMGILGFVLSLVLSSTLHAQTKLDSASTKAKIYLLTSTYGVVAGTFTGLGSLAFYDKPSEHTRNIAMGASIGLYVGLLLGVYMIYVVPGPSDKSPSGGSSPGGSSAEDPLRLGTSETLQNPLWTPYFAYDEIKKVSLVGVQAQF